MFFKFITSKVFWMNVLAALVLLFLLGFITNLVLDHYTRHGESRKVPDLKGISIEKAKVILSEQKLRYQVVDSVFFAELPKMSVTEQTPAAGSDVKEDRIIYLTINAANSPKVTVPDLHDQSLRSARSILESAGLRVGRITEKDDIASDVILGQGIKAGTIVEKGTEIPLTVSKMDGADGPAEVPDMSGLTVEAAKTLLEENGLTLGAIVPENAKDATIYKQKPSSGTSVPRGTAVDLFVK